MEATQRNATRARVFSWERRDVGSLDAQRGLGAPMRGSVRYIAVCHILLSALPQPVRLLCKAVRTSRLGLTERGARSSLANSV